MPYSAGTIVAVALSPTGAIRRSAVTAVCGVTVHHKSNLTPTALRLRTKVARPVLILCHALILPWRRPSEPYPSTVKGIALGRAASAATRPATCGWLDFGNLWGHLRPFVETARRPGDVASSTVK